jgi:subtilisin family serine protease
MGGGATRAAGVSGRIGALALLTALVVAGLPAESTASDGSHRVIVTGVAGAAEAVAEAVVDAGGTILRRLDVVDGVVADVPTARVGEVSGAPSVRAVTADGSVTVSGAYDDYDPSAWTGSLPAAADVVGASRWWDRGLTGAGVDVALVDTGVSEVPGLDAGQVLHGPDLSFDSQHPATIHLDTYGHGTHLAGIIAGREAGAPTPSSTTDDGSLTGIAPGARLVSVKIGDRNGVADVSQAIAAIDWVVQHRDRDSLNIRVLNLSFGFESEQGYELDPLAHAAEVAWRHGIVVVAAAGNGGRRSQLSSPAYSPNILAVGATDSKGTRTTADDEVPSWSSCDPRRSPDLVAPGRSVVSTRSPVSFVAHHFPESEVTPTLMRGSGTSQSAAVVSGAAALVLQARPEATPDQVKQLLMGTADPLREASRTCQGRGIVDLQEVATAATPSGRTSPVWSTGTGSLEDARGPLHVGDTTRDPTDPDAGLTGEQDIFGVAWDPARWSSEALAGTSWDGGWWNGSQWTGSQWTGSQWTGSQWTGSQWTGSQWTGSQWTGSQWTGSQWTSVHPYSATWD